MAAQDKRHETRERLALQDERLQKIARHYDRLEEKLKELESMLPQFDPPAEETFRPNQPR